MSVKVLRRIQRPQKNMPDLFDSRLDAIKSLFSLRGARKSASGESPSAIESVKEFFTMNAPDISISSIAEMASKLKTPLIVALGVAAVAAIIYLVYKVYTNKEPIQKAISDFIADIRNVAPDLTAVPGWLDSIRNEVVEAFAAGSPATIVERLVRIKNAVLGHQKSINSNNIGRGLLELPSPGKHVGYGLKVPM